MVKIWKYVVTSVGLIFLLKLAGLSTGTEAMFSVLGLVFGSSGEILSITTSDASLFTFIFGSAGILVTIAAATGAVIAGLLTRAKPENIILLPLATTVLVLFIQASIGVMITANSLGQGWISGIIFFFLLPYTTGFIIALAEFFRGTD